ncbi:MAG: pentapeptide repeat-containing protein [Chloroflexota bacterium]
MKRIYLLTSVLVLAALACSFGGGQPSSQPSDEAESAPGPSGARPTLPVIEGGDCSAGGGPGVNLAKCDLTERNYTGANFTGANLAQAIFSNSNFSEADFTNANLAGAFASDTNFLDAIFINADLTNADMRASNLINADFTGAITVGVDFSGSNMTGAIITDKQLDQAYSVKDAILPDGSIGK